ncbi:MAG: hypothetical protein Q9227_009055 [Pyrenula ochraceoflavens]
MSVDSVGMARMGNQEDFAMPVFTALFSNDKRTFKALTLSKVHDVFTKVKTMARGENSKRIKFICGDDKIEVQTDPKPALVDKTWTYTNRQGKTQSVSDYPQDAANGRKICVYNDPQKTPTNAMAGAFWLPTGKHLKRLQRPAAILGPSFLPTKTDALQMRFQQMTVSGTFAHLTKSRGMIVDKAYGWDACVSLFVSAALENADSYAKLAVAWYLQTKGSWAEKIPQFLTRTTLFKNVMMYWIPAGGFWKDWSKGVLVRSTLRPPKDDGELGEVKGVERGLCGRFGGVENYG